MKLRFVSLIGFLAVTQIGCTAFQESYKKDYCNYNGAFGKGINEGKAGLDFQIGVARMCDQQDQEIVEQAYRDGFEIGLRKAPNRVTVKNFPKDNCDEEGNCWE